MREPPDRRAIRDTYEKIADHFADTRQHGWDEVLEFLSACPHGRTGIDIGAANGRHLPALSSVVDQPIALDLSRPLLTRGREDFGGLQVEWVEGDASNLPIANSTIDIAIAIATYHHLPTQADRLQSFNELARVLSPAGIALISVWSITHNKFNGTEATDATVPWTLPSGETIERYYHLYDLESFEHDIQLSTLSHTTCYESGGNLYAVVGP